MDEAQATQGLWLQPHPKDVVRFMEVLLERAVLVPALACTTAVQQLEQPRQRRIESCVFMAKQRLCNTPLAGRDTGNRRRRGQACTATSQSPGSASSECQHGCQRTS